MKDLKEILKRFNIIFSDFTKGFLSRSTDVIEAELKEMENAFALITTGALTGMPAPPTYIGIMLLPYMERELKIMLTRATLDDDQLSQWFSILDFG